MKKHLVVVLIVILFANITVFAKSDYNSEIENAAKYIESIVTEPTVSSIGGEWAVLGLARSDENVSNKFNEIYVKNLSEYLYENGGVLHDKKYTEYSRVILALSAIGLNPENVCGYNLLLPLADYEKTIWQGLNGPIWALLALDSKNYEIPINQSANIQATREMYIDKIISAQMSDGGWSLTSDGESDVDITAMALTALAKYKDKENVDNAIKNALAYLSRVQNDDGGFSSWGTKNSESTAQVVIAMCALGLPQTDNRFIKNEKSPIDNLLTYYVKDKGFNHTYEGSGSNQMATEQSFYALVAYDRFQKGKTSLFDMSDVDFKEVTSNEKSGLENKNNAVKKLPIIFGEKYFSDTNNEKITALARRGMVSGRSENQFEPNGTMTRAEFAAITVKSLGLDLYGKKIFNDVTENEWFYNYIATANQYGIVNGVSETEFNPNGNITKEEAATMIKRTSILCGINKDYQTNEIRDILSAFTDYVKASDWSREALCFCYDNGILDENDIEINPKKHVTREEIAVMLYNLLEKSKLL